MPGRLLYTLAAGAAGLVIGCYLNTLAYRLSTVGTEQETGFFTLTDAECICPVCRHPLRPWEQLPVIGFLLLGGRCRYCHAEIDIHYPLVEAGTAVLYALLAACCFPAVLPTLLCMLLSAVMLIHGIVRRIRRQTEPLMRGAYMRRYPGKAFRGLLMLLWFHALAAVILLLSIIACS